MEKCVSMKRLFPILIFVAICFFAGYLSRLLQAPSLETWYPGIVKSPLTPPAMAFPVVWAVLYLLMGVAAGILWGERSVYLRLLFTLFTMQLVLNVVWSFCFFYMQSPLMGLVTLLEMDMLALMFVAGCFVVCRVAGWLMVPYLVWLLFATYLNGYTAVYNLCG